MSKRTAHPVFALARLRLPQLGRLAGWLLATTLAATLAAGPTAPPAEATPRLADAAVGPSAVAAMPSVETAPVAHEGYATMGVTLWLHPRDRALSLVIGTDRQGAVEVYDLAGRRRQRVAAAEPLNVDVLGDLVAVTDPEAAPGGLVRFYTVDRAGRMLRSAGTVDTAVVEHGVCLYRGRGGTLYAFVTSTSGRVAQYALGRAGAGPVTARLVRGPWDVGGSTEGCAADHARGVVYLGEEHNAVWAYGAEPTAGTTDPVRIDVSGGDWLAGDIEGLAVAGRWLVVSSQGDSSFVVYDVATRAARRKLAVGAGPRTDGCDGAHGIEAAGGSFGPVFPRGVFVCQDGFNEAPAPGRPNFKLVPLDRVLP